MFEGIVVGLGQMGSLTNLLFMNVGVLIGIIFGAIPGLTVLLAIVLFLPLTFGLSDTTGILMLIGIYCGGSYGGSISAILINTPGTPNAAATVIDGYALAKKGRAKSALMVALYASVFGGVVSAIVLLFAAPPIAKVTRFFGPAEYFTLAVFGISIIAGVSGKNMLKGIMAG
ncbi:MAG: tripartite tricarboxylate transporter permease, partial [Sphaerochaeta sp.]|nr:tripartite tricarboxylate transporter permease [Sphaerochaeta sp.]